MWNNKWTKISTAPALIWKIIFWQVAFFNTGCRICYAPRPANHSGWLATIAGFFFFLLFMQGFRWQLLPPPPLSLQRSTGPNATAADRPMGSTSSCRALTPITKTGPALHRLSAISVPIGTWLDNTPKHTSFHLYKQCAPTSNFAYQVQRVLTLLKFENLKKTTAPAFSQITFTVH